MSVDPPAEFELGGTPSALDSAQPPRQSVQLAPVRSTISLQQHAQQLGA
jgi:hypothetical protein